MRPLFLSILIICLPFGTAVQTIILGLTAIALIMSKKTSWRGAYERVGAPERCSIALILAVVGFQLLATVLNPQNPSRELIQNFLGFVGVIFVPSLFLLHAPLRDESLRGLERLWAIVFVLWGIAAFSQNLLGWKISGSSIVTGSHYMRAQGFYSHPLTLAYVALLLWPLNLVLLRLKPQSLWRWAATLGNLSLLFHSMSRTVQAVALLLTLIFILLSLRGKARLEILGGLIVSLTLVLATDNSVSRRFHQMLGPQLSEEKESQFADDRIAFWLAHWEMVKERPILGHGVDLNKNYRMPYYEKIGLGGFQKAYEAHNQYLQLAAEGGVLCALTFVLWMVSLLWNWRDGPKALKTVRNLALSGLALGGLTQNAFMDIEVRYAITLLLILAFISVNRLRRA